MLNDIGAAMERGENIDESEQLHFKVLVAHREGHHPLIEPSLAEQRLRVLVHELKNVFAASLDFGLERAHY